MWWVLVLLFVHLTCRLVSTFSCTLYHDITPINVFLHDKKGLGKKNKKGWHCDNILVHLKKFKPSSFLSTSPITFISSHLPGESTLRGGGQKCCHIVLFSRGVHVLTSTMVILEHVFPKNFHNMVDYNTKSSIAIFKKKFNLYCVIPKYICGKINLCHYVLKNENIFKKWLKWFLVLMKFVIFIKHFDYIWLE